LNPNPETLMHWGAAEYIWAATVIIPAIILGVSLYIYLLRKSDSNKNRIDTHDETLKSMVETLYQVKKNVAEDHEKRISVLEAHAEDDRNRHARIEQLLDRQDTKLDKITEAVNDTLKGILQKLVC